MTSRDIRAVDFTAISAAIQAPSDTPTTVRSRKIELIEKIEIEIGQIVDRAHARRQFRAAERRDASAR